MFVYKPNFIPRSIILIGAGGTGGWLAPALVRLVRSQLRANNPNGWLFRLPIYVFDADLLEDKNLVRQHFAPQDVGKPKSFIVAERYSQALGVPVTPVVEMFGPNMNQIIDAATGKLDIGQILANSIVISAVDSAQARRDILTTLFKYLGMGVNPEGTNDFFFIDAGNEDDFGQIKFCTNSYVLQGTHANLDGFLKPFSERPLVECQVKGIPIDFEHYTNLGSSAQEVSCAELPQTLAINYMMAALMLNVIQRFLQMRPLTFDGQRISSTGAMTVERSTLRRWCGRSVNGRPSWAPGRTIYLPLFTNTHGDEVLGPYLADIKAAYKAAGVILQPNGDLVPIAPPKVAKPVVAEPGPAEKALKKIAAKKKSSSASIVRGATYPVVDVAVAQAVTGTSVPASEAPIEISAI